ncbi:hypothetical protein SDC9_133159 [bioreactor metagenome]|uniref:Uncharacterized protein n=1 Tax=bioreactor metagenome TaxID=1076179 RepID=A0A645D9I4_9ZZZZ
MFDGKSKTVLESVQVLNQDAPPIQNDMRYLEIKPSLIHNQAMHLRKRIHLSFHYRLRHYILMDLSHHELSNASLLAKEYNHFHKLVDKILHPDTRPSSYENLYHYGWQQDTSSYLDKSSHLKTYS